MSSQAPPGLQVEKVLDDLIHRLVNTDSGPEVRAALIEARRLKNVAMRWAAIPPPPDARREMLARVMELIDNVNRDVEQGTERRPSGSPDAREDGAVRSRPPMSPRRSFESPSQKPSRDSSPISQKPAASAPPKPSETPTSPPPPDHPAHRPPASRVEEDNEEVAVPKAAPVPKIEERKPLTLRPPGAVAIDTSQPFSRAASSPPGTHDKAQPIKAVGAVRGDTFEGLSSTISSSKRQAISESSKPPSPAPRSRPWSAKPAGPTAKPLGDIPTFPPSEVTPVSSQPRRMPPPLPKRRSSSGLRLPSSKPPVLSASPTPLPPAPGDVSVSIAGGVTLVRPGLAEWQPHPAWEGTFVKLLSHDGATSEYTALVKLSAGGSLPARKHQRMEEMWMVSGAATIGEVEMKAGEYSRADVGSTHPKIFSAAGCTFLLRGSEHDEPLSESGR